MIAIACNRLGEVVLIQDLGRTVETVVLESEFAAIVTAHADSADPVFLGSLFLSASLVPALEAGRRLHVRTVH